MLMAARHVTRALDFVRDLSGENTDIAKAVEAGKKQFVGSELIGRTLGVIGLGAIGVKIANAAVALDMNVIGFDPDITVQRAWQMSSSVQQASSVDDLLSRVDFVSFHVPLVDATRHMISEERLRSMKDGVVLLNFSRNGIIDDQAAVKALDEGKLYAYVCDFPSNLLKDHPRVVTLPHLGASTREAEDNCAVMVAEEIRDYLENGNVRNSVNFPKVYMKRYAGYRLAVVNENVPNMLGQISTALADAGLNIIDMINKSRGELAYTLVDVETEIGQACVERISATPGVRAVRVL
jgi:D-3-phosphoglycerate dehydrogenase